MINSCNRNEQIDIEQIVVCSALSAKGDYPVHVLYFELFIMKFEKRAYYRIITFQEISFVVTPYHILQNEHLMCRNTRPSVAVRLGETNAEGMGDELVDSQSPSFLPSSV